MPRARHRQDITGPTKQGHYWWICACGDEGGPYESYNRAWDATVDHERKETKTMSTADALKPFAAFADAWDRMPLRGIHDEVYKIHGGTEWEGVLRLSDCQRARSALSALSAETWERKAYERALDLLQRLVQDAVPQAGPGYGERDVNRDDLNAVCAEAETLLYEARGRA